MLTNHSVYHDRSRHYKQRMVFGFCFISAGNVGPEKLNRTQFRTGPSLTLRDRSKNFFQLSHFFFFSSTSLCSHLIIFDALQITFVLLPLYFFGSSWPHENILNYDRSDSQVKMWTLMVPPASPASVSSACLPFLGSQSALLPLCITNCLSWL